MPDLAPVKARDRLRKSKRKASVTLQGEYLSWKDPTHHRLGKKPKKRKPICTFSQASRFRLLKQIAKIEWAKANKVLFCTLTYPDDKLPKDYDEQTIYRSHFWERLEAECEDPISAIWRIEWLPRKTGKHKGTSCPHIHLVIFGIGYIAYSTINQIWRKTLGTEGYVRTDIRRSTHKQRNALYVGKYAAKPEDVSLVYASYLTDNLGRAWGTHRKNRLPVARIQEAEIPAGELAAELRNDAAGMSESIFTWGHGSFTLLGQRAKKLAEKIFDKKD